MRTPTRWRELLRQPRMRELIDRRILRTKTEARHALFGYIEGWYNPRRRHSAFGYVSPVHFERKINAENPTAVELRTRLPDFPTSGPE